MCRTFKIVRRKSIHAFKSSVLSPAFTLAETLIVMGIIGVVAALTIPNLTQSTGEMEKVAKLKKLHANLEDAFGRAQAVYGPIVKWKGGNTTNFNVRFADRMLEYMKVSKNCGIGTNGTCFTSGASKKLNGENGDNINSWSSEPKVILADGTSVNFLLGSNACTTFASYAPEGSPLLNICGTIIVDIDGPNKGSYTWGDDIFSFWVTKTGIYPAGTVDDNFFSSFCINNGTACASWVIYNGNMDYLKVTNGTCPNGTVLNWTKTSCK